MKKEAGYSTCSAVLSETSSSGKASQPIMLPTGIKMRAAMTSKRSWKQSAAATCTTSSTNGSTNPATQMSKPTGHTTKIKESCPSVLSKPADSSSNSHWSSQPTA